MAKEFRLTIIISSAFETSSGAEVFYLNLKNCLNSFDNISITGNIVKSLDPCCGKGQIPKWTKPNLSKKQSPS